MHAQVQFHYMDVLFLSPATAARASWSIVGWEGRAVTPGVSVGVVGVVQSHMDAQGRMMAIKRTLTSLHLPAVRFPGSLGALFPGLWVLRASSEPYLLPRSGPSSMPPLPGQFTERAFLLPPTSHSSLTATLDSLLGAIEFGIPARCKALGWAGVERSQSRAANWWFRFLHRQTCHLLSASSFSSAHASNSPREQSIRARPFQENFHASTVSRPTLSSSRLH
jgi:hypothetical protein